MPHTTGNIKNMSKSKRQLPEKFKVYLNGADDWTRERRAELLQNISAYEPNFMWFLGTSTITPVHIHLHEEANDTDCERAK